MIQFNNEIFADEKEMEACITYLLEVKYGYNYSKLKQFDLRKKKELYKSAKRKRNKAPSANGQARRLICKEKEK